MLHPNFKKILIKASLGIAIQTGFLHGINGIPQKFMGILLAAKAKMSGDFCDRWKMCFCKSETEKSSIDDCMA